MFKSWRALLAAALVSVPAFAFGTLSTAQAITCSGGGVGEPAQCSDALPFPQTYSDPVNPPSDFLNGSPSLAKFDNFNADTLTFGAAIPGQAGDYTPFFSFSDVTATTGDWTFNAVGALAAGLALVPTMLAIKAGPNWGFYAFLAGTFSGSWDTADLPLVGGQVPALSHLVFYDSPLPPGTPREVIPIPGAFLLMGTVIAGGGGFAAWRRRRERKA